MGYDAIQGINSILKVDSIVRNHSHAYGMPDYILDGQNHKITEKNLHEKRVFCCKNEPPRTQRISKA